MNIKRIFMCLLMIVMIAFGCALTLKAEIGVGAWDALAQTGSFITHIKVGTMGMALNFICIFLQWLLLRKDFKIKHALQIVLCFLLGYAVNFFLYSLLDGMDVSSYATRLLLLVSGHILIAIVVSVIMLLNVVTFALEGACMAVANKWNLKFHVLRQMVDVGCILLALALSWVFQVPFAIREGTLIGMLIFGPLVGYFMKHLKPILKRYDLCD